VTEDWNGEAPQKGWHWLIRRNDRRLYVGCWDRLISGWRISDAIGRTIWRSPQTVARLYAYGRPIEEPKEIAL
jgi:hypothetical protein